MYHLYKDGKDLYITDKKLNETEYEEKVTHKANLDFLVTEATLRIGDGQADYLWVDKDSIKKINNSAIDIGVFCVNNGEVIELDGGLTC